LAEAHRSRADEPRRRGAYFVCASPLWIERTTTSPVFTHLDAIAGTSGRRLFMPWTVANAMALTNGRDEFSVELGGRTWTQKPQKYHAKSLAVLREKYQAVGHNRALKAILDASRCLTGLLDQ